MAPFLILLFLGGFELTRYVNSMRKLTYTSNAIAQMLAQNTSGSVGDDELHFYFDASLITFPEMLSDSLAKGMAWWSDIHIAMSSVAFKPTVTGCTSGCTYKANTAWSYGDYARACGVPLVSTANTSPPSPTTLPSDVFGPGSLIVVDVVYNYTPIVAPQIFGTMTIRRSAYIQPRYVSLVTYSSGGMATKCAGY